MHRIVWASNKTLVVEQGIKQFPQTDDLVI